MIDELAAFRGGPKTTLLVCVCVCVYMYICLAEIRKYRGSMIFVSVRYNVVPNCTSVDMLLVVT